MAKSKLINKEYYFGVTDNENMYVSDYSKEMYMDMFLDEKKIKFCEYKVKLVKIKKNSPNKEELCYDLEIIEIISVDKEHNYDNKPGDIVYAWRNFDKCDIKNKLLPHNPEVGINDGGTINCWGCYGALLIPYEEYEQAIKPKLVTVKDRKILLEIMSYNIDNQMTHEINSMEVDDPDEPTDLSDYNEELDEEPGPKFDYSNQIYHLYRKCRTFGFVNSYNKFIIINKSDNYIAFFLSNYLG